MLAGPGGADFRGTEFIGSLDPLTGAREHIVTVLETSERRIVGEAVICISVIE